MTAEYQREDDTKRIAVNVQAAISDEWYAHYYYWLGSVIMSPPLEFVMDEFKEHALNEYEHATKLAGWLRMVPRQARLPYTMSELIRNKSVCGSIFPSGNVPSALIADAIEGEKCAIVFYSKLDELMETSEFYGSDLIDIVKEILRDEKKHIADLYQLQEDMINHPI